MLLDSCLLCLSSSLISSHFCFLLLANYLQLSDFIIFCLFFLLSFHLTLICFFLQSSCSSLYIINYLRLIILLNLLLDQLLLLCNLNRLFCNLCWSWLVLKRFCIKALIWLQSLCFLFYKCWTRTFNIWLCLRSFWLFNFRFNYYWLFLFGTLCTHFWISFFINIFNLN